MLKRRSAENISFFGVGIFFILIGVSLFSLGSVQSLGQFMWEWQYGWPMAKIMGGLIIIGLGYIIIQLEIIRRRSK